MSRTLPAARPALPRPSGWGVPSVATVGIGLVLGAIAYSLQLTSTAVAIAGGSTLMVAVVVVLNIRSRRHSDIVDKYLLVIASTLGFGAPNRSLVQASRWDGFFGGRPHQLRITYHPGVDEKDPSFAGSLLETAERRFGARYRIAKHDVRRCAITLVARSDEESKEPEQEQRVRSIVRELLGPVQVSVQLEGQDLIAFGVDYGINPKLTRAAVRRQFERYLDSGLPGRWRAHWDLENDSVNFELRPEMPTMIMHEPPPNIPESTHDAYMDAVIPYATDEDGHPIVWKPSEIPHMLIIGGTGSGKTTELHTILTHVALLGWRIHVLDGKRVEFIGFRDWPNVELVASSVGAQVRMVHYAHDVMMERYDLLESGQATIEDFEPLIVIIDEYASFRDAVEDWYPEVKPKGAPTKPRVFRLVGNIARLGRTAKVHLVVGIQRPDVTFLAGEMRDNFGARTSLGRLSPQGAQMMWDSPAIGATRVPRGHGIALDDRGEPVEVLTHFTPNPAKVHGPEHPDYNHLEALRPQHTNYPRKRIAEPQAQADIDDTGEETVPLYPEYAAAAILPYTGPPTAALRTRQTPARGDRPRPTDEAATDVGQLPEDGVTTFQGYKLSSPVSAGTLEEGYAVCYDDSLDLWGVVTCVEDDGFEDNNVFIEYQDLESGESGVVSVSADDLLTARVPTTERRSLP